MNCSECDSLQNTVTMTHNHRENLFANCVYKDDCELEVLARSSKYGANGQNGSSERFSVLCAKFRDRSLFMYGGKGRENHGVGQAYFILEKRGEPKRFSLWLGVGHCHGVL